MQKKVLVRCHLGPRSLSSVGEPAEPCRRAGIGFFSHKKDPGTMAGVTVLYGFYRASE